MERKSGSRTTYQFTLEQIESMKRQAVLDAKEKMKEEITKEIDEHIKKNGNSENREMSGENEQNGSRRFWRFDVSSCTDPVRSSTGKVSGMRMITGQSSFQFSEAVVKEVNRICGDENADIRKYRDETYELYGVKYEVK